jgi:hypothetical protein
MVKSVQQRVTNNFIFKTLENTSLLSLYYRFFHGIMAKQNNIITMNIAIARYITLHTFPMFMLRS